MLTESQTLPPCTLSAEELLAGVFECCIKLDVSDIQMRSNRPVYVEMHSGMEKLDQFGTVTPDLMAGVFKLLLSHKKASSHGFGDEAELTPEEALAHEIQEFKRTKVADYSCAGIEYRPGSVSGRLRIQAHLSSSGLGLTCRILNDGIPPLDILGIEPDVVEALQRAIQKRAGLCLVTGPTGSGKSTTLAAIIDWCRQNHSKHIVTIEDPIEYEYPNDMTIPGTDQKMIAPAIVTQQEVGRDIHSFRQGLKDVLRKAPHIILLGEIRDQEAMETCMEAAQTGHLVLSTLHTTGAVKTIGRILELYPQESHASVVSRLSEVLIFIQSQGLLKGTEKRVLTYEFLNNCDDSTAAAIMHYDKGSNALEDVIMRSGNVRWDAKLRSLLDSGAITQETFDNARLSNEDDVLF